MEINIFINKHIIQRRKKWDMSETNDNDNMITFSKIWDAFCKKHVFLCSVLGSIVATMMITIASNLVVMGTIPEKIDNIENKIGEFKQETKEELGKIEDKIENSNKDIREVSERVAVLEGKTFATTLEPAGYFASAVVTTYKSAESESFHNYAIGEDKEIIGTDIKTGDKYTIEELVDSKLLVPYKEDGKEIFFLGQYNEKNHWDGNCIINVYENHELISITDAEYKDGEVSNYEQVFRSKDKRSWLVSDRMHEGEYNSGETWQYIYKDYNQTFEFSDVLVSDIINVEKFVSTMSLELEGYYNGNTSEGYYSDNTGEAYLVKYADDGTVRTLYKGIFVKGYFEDITRKAWYITKDIDTDYMYYQGIFRKGHPTREGDYVFKNPVTQEKINEIVEGMEFNCELNWFTSESV